MPSVLLLATVSAALLVISSIHVSLGQGYGNIPGDDQPSGNSIPRPSFDASQVPSFGEPDQEYREQKCAAEFQTPQTSAPTPSDVNSTPQVTTPPNLNLNAENEPRSLIISTLVPSSDEIPGPEATTLKEPENEGGTSPAAATTTISTVGSSEPEADPRIDVRAQTSSTPADPASTEPTTASAAPASPEPRSAMFGDENVPSGSNQLKSELPNNLQTDALIQLITDLNKKLKDLEETQRALNKNVEDLQNKLEQVLPVKKDEATNDLISGQPEKAIESWNALEENIDSVQELSNVTNDIVVDALDQQAPPPAVMDFVHQLPNKPVQEGAYNAVADKMADSDKVQEKMSWKEMTPYCRNAAMDTGRSSPTTMKMLNLQNQMRLQGAKPIAQGSNFIQGKQYQPAANVWMNLVQDIPESPSTLENNMKKMMIRTYDKNPFNLPNAFQFILVLPENQGSYKRVAYNCLLQEMQANGHSYDPSNMRGNQPLQQQQQQPRFQPSQNFPPPQQQRPHQYLPSPQRPQQQQQQFRPSQQPQPQQRPRQPQQQAPQPSSEVYRYY